MLKVDFNFTLINFKVIFVLQACRIYENELIEILAKETKTEEEKMLKFKQLHSVYMELGHINLLAHDFARGCLQFFYKCSHFCF